MSEALSRRQFGRLAILGALIGRAAKSAPKRVMRVCSDGTVLIIETIETKARKLRAGWSGESRPDFVAYDTLESIDFLTKARGKNS